MLIVRKKELEHLIHLKTVYNMEDKNRATGRTNRLIQFYIDKLFTTNDEVVIYDHFDHSIAHKFLTDAIIRRMNNEMLLRRTELTLNKINSNTLQLTHK
jgi:ribosomal protein L31E